MGNRQIVLDAIQGKKVPYVPFGAWYGWYDVPTEYTDGLKETEFVQSVIEKHKDFIRRFRPDIVKIMTAGFFRYPGFERVDFTDMRTLKNARPLGADHPWIREQVRLTREIAEELKEEGVLFYNVFAPFTYIRFAAVANGYREEDLVEFLLKDPKSYQAAVETVTADLKLLVKAVIREGGADAIFFSVRNLPTPELTNALYGDYIAPYEKEVLDMANSLSPYTMLHICGSRGKNDLARYRNYKAGVYNWATIREGVTLKEGKEFFGGKPVLGGFSNTADGIMNRGTKEEIEAETARLLDETGTTGVILGFDCAVLPEVEPEHLIWAREKAKNYRGAE